MGIEFLFGMTEKMWKKMVVIVDIMNVINAVESSAYKWLKWQFFCYVYFTTIKEKEQQQKKRDYEI